MNKRNFILSLLVAFALGLSAQVRVACIGNSITFGYGIEDRENNSYPAQLQQMLGDDYLVGNFGVSGTTAQKEADSPWNKTQQYVDAKAFLPQICVIKLGTNDSKEHNWVCAERFAKDLEELAEEFSELESHPRIIIALPAKAYEFRFHIRDSIIFNFELPAICEMAQKRNWKLIDLYTATSNMPENFPDGIHPNPAGAAIIANEVKKAIIDK